MSDNTAPVLLGLTLPSSIDVSSDSASFFLGVHADDGPGGTGIYEALVEFTDVMWISDPRLLHFTDTLGMGGMLGSEFRDATPTMGQRIVPIGNLTQSGSYEVARVVLMDRAGNRTVYDTSQLKALGFATSFTVTGGLVDNVAPSLDSVKLPASIDLSLGFSQHIFARTDVRDIGGAGVLAMSITFDKPLLMADGSMTDRLDASALGRKQVASAVELWTGLMVSGKAAPGVYNITQVQVRDYLNNVREYTTEQLKAMGVETAMTLIGNPLADPSKEPPKAALSWTMDEQGLLLTVTPESWGSAPLNGFGVHFGFQLQSIGLGGVTLSGGATGEVTVVQNDNSGITIAGKNVAGGGPGSSLALRITPPPDGGAIELNAAEFTINGQLSAITDGIAYYKGTDAADHLDLDRRIVFLDGGDGFDTLRLHGPRSDYRITKEGDGFAVKAWSRFLEPERHLLNIERLAFDDDRHVALDAAGRAEQLTLLYQAAFDRAPDQTGISHWLGRMDAGDSLEQIAGYFVASKEFADLYGTAASDRDFVTALYDNVLDRQPDTVGLDFWTGVLGRGDLSRAEVLVEFSESPENVAQVVGATGYTPDFLA